MNILNIIKNSSIFRGKSSLIGSILAGVVAGICLFWLVMPQISNARFDSNLAVSYVAKAGSQTTQKIIKKIQAVTTAYSSTADQTDDTPFITASGKTVKDGIIANNALPMGTKVRIPKLYGDKVFIVEDRMNKRMGNHRFDIWMPTTAMAIKFGVKSIEIEVLED